MPRPGLALRLLAVAALLGQAEAARRGGPAAIGIGIAILVVIIACCCGGFYLYRRRMNRKEELVVVDGVLQGSTLQVISVAPAPAHAHQGLTVVKTVS